MANEQSNVLHALIYGSCVSRDLVRIDHKRFQLVHYTARQSWVSAYSDASVPPKISLSSAFQRRMVEDDFRSSARGIFDSSRPAKSDVILLDLIDERLGVLPFSGGWITRSNELVKSSALSEDELRDFTEFGSECHFELWQKAALRLRDQLDSYIDKTFVLAAYFAEESNMGEPLKEFRGIQSPVWNSRFERYYGELIQLGFRVIAQPSEFVVANEHHLWGPTPFHYPDEAYYSFGDQVVQAINQSA